MVPWMFEALNDSWHDLTLTVNRVRHEIREPNDRHEDYESSYQVAGVANHNTHGIGSNGGTPDPWKTSQLASVFVASVHIPGRSGSRGYSAPTRYVVNIRSYGA